MGEERAIGLYSEGLCPALWGLLIKTSHACRQQSGMHTCCMCQDAKSVRLSSPAMGTAAYFQQPAGARLGEGFVLLGVFNRLDYFFSIKMKCESWDGPTRFTFIHLTPMLTHKIGFLRPGQDLLGCSSESRPSPCILRG